ncbi:MAG: zinc dependent phospholipase C family protein [Chitinophagaceae bacterium]|nr:zinc dependent phospholipase C family protein [Chitinophagaceae bacterium]
MKKLLLSLVVLVMPFSVFCWGFYAHRQINYYAVFLLPPEMVLLYKPNIGFISEHAVDPDKRRYAVAEEGPRHYIDIDHYDKYPFDSLPRKWADAEMKYSADTLMQYGIVPWWIQTMVQRLTNAFQNKNHAQILKLSAELGHYVADAHVPLHACSNHNGQFTNQQGIHGFWESRIPELLAKKEFDFIIGKAEYITSVPDFIWKRILESAAAADTVLKYEKDLSLKFPESQKFSFEERNGTVIKQFSTAYSNAYHKSLNGMIERRMRQSIYATASLWFTAWVNAGQPDLAKLTNKEFTEEERKEFEELNRQWRNTAVKGRICD